MGKKEKKEKKEKPLERMTAKELREYALSLGEIVGVHGMNKEELIRAIKEVKGIKDEGGRKAAAVNVRELKEKLRQLRQQKIELRLSGATRSAIDMMRRRINRLKKRTRKAA